MGLVQRIVSDDCRMAAESAGQIAPEGECLLLILLFMPESAVAGVAHIALAAAARQRKHGEHDLQPAPMRPVQECAKQLQVPLVDPLIPVRITDEKIARSGPERVSKPQEVDSGVRRSLEVGRPEPHRTVIRAAPLHRPVGHFVGRGWIGGRLRLRNPANNHTRQDHG
jgi:hypothetical protein